MGAHSVAMCQHCHGASQRRVGCRALIVARGSGGTNPPSWGTAVPDSVLDRRFAIFPWYALDNSSSGDGRHDAAKAVITVIIGGRALLMLMAARFSGLRLLNKSVSSLPGLSSRELPSQSTLSRPQLGHGRARLWR